jgi:glyoxylase-like metal-dependent hydrolase (beta-lactamase superfamily II)
MIYQYKVGQADSQLIVGPTGRIRVSQSYPGSMYQPPPLVRQIQIVLRGWNSTQGAKAVAQKIHQVMGSNYNRLDYIVATHLHADHIGYFGRGGIWALIENHGFTVGTLIDRDAGVWSDANGNNTFDNGEITWHNAGTTSGTANNWLAYVTTHTPSSL